VKGCHHEGLQGDSMGLADNAGFDAKVQQIVGIYKGWIGYCPTSLQKGNGTSAKTQTIQLPSLYAHRSVMQRRP